VRVSPCDPQYPDEICTTLNVSRNGLYFMTTADHYYIGMNVIITLNFGPDDPMHREQIGDVVRMERLDQDRWGIAIRILMHSNPGIYSGT